MSDTKLGLSRSEWKTLGVWAGKALLVPFFGASILLLGMVAVMAVFFFIFSIPFPIFSIGFIAESGFSETTKNILGIVNMFLTCGFWGLALISENNN